MNLTNTLTKAVVVLVASAAVLGFAFAANAATYTYPGYVLKAGQKSAAVSALQTALNQAGYTPALSTDGSFGPMTTAAVKWFQSTHALAVDGSAGPATAAALTSALATMPSTPSQGNCPTGYVQVTPVAPTFASCAIAPSTGGSNGGSSTGLSGEGSIENIDVSDADDTDLEEGQSEAELGVLEFTAEDGDVLVNRIDVVFEAAGGNDEDRPWNVFDSVSLMVDGDEIASMDTDSKSDWDELNDTNDVYRVRFSGLDWQVDEDEDAEVTVVAEVASSVDGADDGESWAISFENELGDADGIRYEDADGFLEETGSSDTAEFTIEEAGGDSEFEVSESDDSPETGTLEVKASSSSTHTVAVFTASADEDGGDIMVTDFPVDITLTFTDGAAAGTATGADIIDEVELVVDGTTYNGDYEVGSCGGTTGLSDCATTETATFTFEDLEDDEVVIEAGEEMEFEVKVKFKSQGSTAVYNNGATVLAEANVTSSDVEDAESGDDIGTIDGSASAKTQTIASVGISVVGIEKSAERTFVADDASEFDQGTFIIVFEVTAFGDDVFIDNSTPVEDNDGTYATTSTSYSITNSTSNSTVGTLSATDGDYDEGTNGWEIREGDTAEFTLEVIATASADSSAQVTLENIGYALTDANGTTSYLVPDEPEFKTASITLLAA